MRELTGAPQAGDVSSRSRQLDDERAPHARDRTDVDAAAVGVSDSLDSGQPEADAGLAAVPTPHVRLERLLAELGRQARAVVLDLDPDPRIPAILDHPRAYHDARRLDPARVLDGIAQKVGNQAGQNTRVASDRPRRVDLGDDGDLSLSVARRDLLDGAGDHLGDVGLDARLRASTRPRE